MSSTLPYDIDAPIWSESAVLALRTQEADVLVRLCRFPSAGVAWVWANADFGEYRYSYSVDHHRCSAETAQVEQPGVVYNALDVPCLLWRHGPRAAPTWAGSTVELGFHRLPHPPNAVGTEVLRIDARFVPGDLSAELLPGRSELRGMVELRIWQPGGDQLKLSGHGHWHEQHQTTPRFRTPFTYVDLRGPQLTLVAINTPGGVRGSAVCEGRPVAVRSMVLGEQGPERSLRIELEDGKVVTGVARTVRERSVCIYGLRRPGNDVVVEGAGLSGTINDWDPRGESAK